MAGGDDLLGWGLIVAIVVGVVSSIGAKFLLGEASADDFPDELGRMSGTMRSGDLPDPKTSPRVEDIDAEAGAGMPTGEENTEPTVRVVEDPAQSAAWDPSSSARVADIDREAGAGGISRETARQVREEEAEEKARLGSLPDPKTSPRVADIDREAGAGANLRELRALARGG